MKKNKKNGSLIFIGLLLFVLLPNCGKEEREAETISLLTTTVNGIPLVDGTINVAPEARFELSFSARVDPLRFEPAFSLSAGGTAVDDLDFEYQNASTKVTINARLMPATSYELRISRVPVGANEEVLTEEVLLRLTTSDGGTITEQAPCATAGEDCLQRISIAEDAGGSGTFEFFGSFPLEEENARWEKIRYALIVVHGLNRNADDYFSYLTSSLRNAKLSEQTILIAPFFKSQSDARGGDLYWSSSGWREGQASEGPANISSFEVVDQIIGQLANEERFPVLEKVLITGHSSGALFTHTYAAANKSEKQFTKLNFSYGIANSQYFYYPADVRWNASTDQFEAVTNCVAFNRWPLGPVNLPNYLEGREAATINQQLVERKVSYLLGTNDVVTTGTLNTDDCEAVLLGENRFKRGENIFRLMETEFSDTHQHRKVEVSGVGHNAQGMYQSTEVLNWLEEILPSEG